MAKTRRPARREAAWARQADTLDESTREILQAFVREVTDLPNEAAKTHRFVALVSELFPRSRVALLLAEGIEKMVRVADNGGTRRRRIDAYYGNALIEFERSLGKSESVARKQLREQTTGIWSDEGGSERPLLCIATDGITWKVFRPVFQGTDSKRISPDDVQLEELRVLELSDTTLGDFWLWLTSLLFRPGRLRPTVERFQTDFGVVSLAYAQMLEALKAAWQKAKKHSENALLFETWRRYLTVTYGSLDSGRKAQAELELLFLKHTYLASIAKLLVWTFLSKGRTRRPLREVARDVLSGAAFSKEGIENLGEEDFFRWVHTKPADPVLEPFWERALAEMLTYDLDRFDQDILKGVYQELVDPKDRHDLGEYYTPEWLCERITAEVLPESGYLSVLDPACGSGSFLRAVIDHFIRSNPSDSEAEQLSAILDHVAGIDIHPLAVTISKATYLLALAQLIKHRARPVSVPVYMADSLFLPQEVRQPELGEEPGYEIQFGGRKVRIAERLVQSGELFDRSISACAHVALDHARTGGESQETLQAYLRRHAPALAGVPEFESILCGLWDFTRELAQLIAAGEDSIWSFVVRNAYRPAMFRSRFDVIIGNPPWLSYRYITDPEYQARVKRLAVNDYGIAPNQKKLFTHMELATLFFVHTLATFGGEGARLAFVIPRSILSADQHTNLRQRKYVGPARLDRYWDLMDVKPLFRVPACVVFASRESVRAVQTLGLPAVEWRGRLPRKDVSWSQAEPFLARDEKKAHLLYLAERTALSTGVGSRKPTRKSSYSKRFRQGATIVPRNFYFVRVKGLASKPRPDSLYWTETDPEQAKLSKPPYRDIAFSGNVEGRFLFHTALSNNVLPFAVVDLPTVVLPVVMKGAGSEVFEAPDLRADGYRGISAWMEEAEREWKEKRGRKADKMSAYERLDYQRGLTNQGSDQRHLVLYNASGTDLSVARLERDELELPFVVDAKLYWLSCSSVEEARYVTAVLNSEEVNRRIKPFQSMGLQGERDIHKKPLDLPIPHFKAADRLHKKLADLGREAEERLSVVLRDLDRTWSLARQRGWIREQVGDVLGEIDHAVTNVLESS